jgi:hypothetical protein
MALKLVGGIFFFPYRFLDGSSGDQCSCDFWVSRRIPTQSADQLGRVLCMVM